MDKSHLKHHNGRTDLKPLGKRLVFGILILSSIITTTFTLFSFYVDYSAEIDNLEVLINQIENSTREPLSQAIWNYDEESILTQSKGILSYPQITEVEIIDNHNTKLAFLTEKTSESKYIESAGFELIYNDNGENKKMGNINLKVSKDAIYQGLIRRASLFFLTQGIKTLIISFLILILIRWMLIRHIEKVARFLSKMDEESDGLRLTLSRKPNSKGFDELDLLVEAVNSMKQRVEEDRHLKNDEINRQKASSIHSAKLASLGEMAAGIAHEINNPLAIISSRAHMISKIEHKNLNSNQRILESCENIHNTVERISKIIRGLLHFSRSDHSEDAEYKTIGARELIDKTLGLFEERFKNNGVELRKAVDIVVEANLSCNQVQIGQVLINLLNNSYDAILDLKEKWISVKIARENEMIVIEVVDSGGGIPESIQEKIFQPFYTTKPIGKGTGLGLGICKGIIEKHHGRFSYETLDGHTCFRILLPVHSEPELVELPPKSA